MIAFIADYFVDEMPAGGSELSLQALIDTCSYPYSKIKSENFDLSKVVKNDFLIFGNFDKLSEENFKALLGYNYVVIESDYKYCHYRSPRIHELKERVECNCRKKHKRAALVFDFLSNAKCLFYKSEKQRDIYETIYPELAERPNMILGAVFSDIDINKILELRDTCKNGQYAILKLKNPLKGYHESLEECKVKKIPFIELDNLPRDEFLKKLAGCSGLYYKPIAEDTCNRVTIEAKLLGLELILGDYCQHKNEFWFNSDLFVMIDYLRNRPSVFWEIIKKLI